MTLPTLFARIGVAALSAAFLPRPLHAQSPDAGYHDGRALRAAFDDLARQHPRLVTVSTLGTSAGGRPLTLVRLGAASDEERPALLVIANAHGPHVVGSEVALRVTQRLAAAYPSDSTVRSALDRSAIYLVPRANPDAAEAMFVRPLVESIRNDERVDDDHDGAFEEDGPEDLDGDGVIAMMRVEDPAGEWLADSIDARLMRKGDRSKGDRGRYRMFTEGRDNDGDEQWNEDPAGGVNIGDNFSFDYPDFGEASGPHTMSAAETRAIAQLMVDHPGIAAIYVLGPEDNLIKAWEGKALPTEGTRPGTSAGGPLRAILKDDEPWMAEVARRFRDITGIEAGAEVPAWGGDPLSWAYFHMGRWAFGSSVWSASADESADDADEKHEDADSAKAERADSTRADSAKADSAKGRRGGGGRGGDKAKDPLEAQRKAIKWLDEHAPESVIAWHPIDHPDFPGQVVELGGIRPFALTNPPAAMLDTISAGQAKFVRELVSLLPAVLIRKVRVEALGGGLFRIRAEIANDGYLPSSTEVGIRLRMPRPVRVRLAVPDGATIVGGRRQDLLEPLPGSGAGVEHTWLVRGSAGSRVTLTAESPVTGRATQTITLR
ncbi:MAG TPA: M14 family metallopeptidase [Gemmatimonadales bacterium]|nr:M14 family metallopeptidase [Gemmatimonadales bacterium]